jgi:mannose-1-phosphate guanylyltransferase / mannose-6-phosphate isomerase
LVHVQKVVVPLACGWSDVGSWAALQTVMDKDDSGNVLLGDVHVRDVDNSFIRSNSRLVTALGISDIVIVETGDAVMVSSMDRVQDVKDIVSMLQGLDRKEVHVHPRVYRPWGNYECIDAGNRYQVKRITVYPGQVLSLQKHFHRSEHWVVVAGTAKVTKGEKEIILTEDQSVYLPLGQVHRLENVGRLNLELIEVQTGAYLGEDDIVRLEDVYGRVES